MRAITQDDDGSQFWSIMTRLERLERASTERTLQVSGVSSVDLGAIQGENIMEVRISLVGTVTVGANTFIRLQPNASPSIQEASIARRSYWDGAATVGDVAFGGNYALGSGIVVCATDWGGNNFVKADGSLSTRIGAYRFWDGTYSNIDTSTNDNRRLQGTMQGVWRDQTTPISSLTLALDAGTFAGTIALEVVS